MQLFEIKYEIFKDALVKFRNINLSTLDVEYEQIYGLFIMFLGGWI